MRGLGVDRHLLGLYILAKGLDMKPMPRLFEDKVWTVVTSGVWRGIIWNLTLTTYMLTGIPVYFQALNIANAYSYDETKIQGS